MDNVLWKAEAWTSWSSSEEKRGWGLTRTDLWHGGPPLLDTCHHPTTSSWGSPNDCPPAVWGWPGQTHHGTQTLEGRKGQNSTVQCEIHYFSLLPALKRYLLTKTHWRYVHFVTSFMMPLRGGSFPNNDPLTVVYDVCCLICQCQRIYILCKFNGQCESTSQYVVWNIIR